MSLLLLPLDQGTRPIRPINATLFLVRNATYWHCPNLGKSNARQIIVLPSYKCTLRHCNWCLNYIITFCIKMSSQRTLTNLIRGSITVQVTSCLTGLNLTIQVNMFLIQHKQRSWIQRTRVEQKNALNKSSEVSTTSGRDQLAESIMPLQKIKIVKKQSATCLHFLNYNFDLP